MAGKGKLDATLPLVDKAPSLWGDLLPKSNGIQLAFWFSVMQIGIKMFHGVFASYHMNMYLTVYGVSAAAMASVHSVFAIWNPVNDLIGAWISDKWAASHNGARVNLMIPQVILWPIVCVLPFYPIMAQWLGVFWLALLALCVEDTFFSWVMILMGGVWTDITSSEVERVKISRLEQIFQQIGLPLVYMNFMMWTRAQQSQHIGGFAHYFSFIAVAGGCVCLLALWKLRQVELDGLCARGVLDETPRQLNIVDFIKKLPSQKNLWCFICMSVLNEMQSQFNAEFAAIFTDINLRNKFGVEARSSYLVFDHLCTFGATIALNFYAQTHGVYSVWLYTVLLKVLAGLALLQMPLDASTAAAYFLFSCVCTSAAQSFFIVTVSNIVDEYRHNEGRHAPSVVGLCFGLHALIAKPLNSLGPVIGTYVFERAGWTGEAMRGPVTESSQLAAFRLMIGFPVLCGFLQILAWSFYDLRGEKLKQIQESLTRRHDDIG
mmetsp:Transcript_90334/g.170310  ORF Transcript_90334/g.170310 Transcript_90334/m.170310 type:complete len:490 (+) Transcript_90334:91-1560(+)